MEPLAGEREVRNMVNANARWHVMSTDHKKDQRGLRVIFYLESRIRVKFRNIEGEVDEHKPIHVADFEASRVKSDSRNVAMQLVNTANTLLSEAMRDIKDKK